MDKDAKQEAPTNQEFVTPIHLIDSIVTNFNKLKQVGLTNQEMTRTIVKDIIADKLVYSVYLKLDDVVIASDSRVDNRPLDVIKEEAVTKKAEVDAKGEQEKAPLDELIAVIEAAPVEKVVEEPVVEPEK